MQHNLATASVATTTADHMLDIAPYTASIDDLEWHRRPQHKYSCSDSGKIVALGKVKCSNGSMQYKAYCLECGGKGTAFPFSQIAGLDDSKIPFISEHKAMPCERCGNTDGSEVHHWAPWHLFEDAAEWPTSHLCKSCHAKWHAKVTPDMSSRRAAV